MPSATVRSQTRSTKVLSSHRCVRALPQYFCLMKYKLTPPAVSCMEYWQLARGFKEDHDSTRAVVCIHKSDCHACHLYRAVQGHHVETPHGHLQALVYQAGCDWRAVDGPCVHPVCLHQCKNVHMQEHVPLWAPSGVSASCVL